MIRHVYTDADGVIVAYGDVFPSPVGVPPRSASESREEYETRYNALVAEEEEYSRQQMKKQGLKLVDATVEIKNNKQRFTNGKVLDMTADEIKARQEKMNPSPNQPADTPPN